MKRGLVITIFLLLVMPSVFALTLNEGDSTTVQDEAGNDRTLLVQTIESDFAAITIDGEYFQIMEGKGYTLNDVIIFVNKIAVQGFEGGAKLLKINDFTILDTTYEYVGFDEDDNEVAVSFEVLEDDTATIIIDDQSLTVEVGESYTFAGFTFYVKDTGTQDFQGGASTLTLGISEGSIVKEGSGFSGADDTTSDATCTDSDGRDFETKGTAKGLWYSYEEAGYIPAEKTDYCWTKSSETPEESGDYATDFFCSDDPRAGKVIVQGTIALCANGCVDGRCITDENADQPAVAAEAVEVSETNDRQFVCGGCQDGETCYPIGYRKSGEYCTAEGSFTTQFQAGAMCENNFECDSNVCVSGECIDQGLLQKILSWFKNIFS